MPQSIGTRRETSLHRELKYSYAGFDGQTEVEVDGYVADGMNARGEYIEVQTGSFGPLRQKAKELTARGKLKIIYPVIITKYIEVFDIKGSRQYRRKSNKHGSPWDIFDALVHAPDLPLIRGLTIELALIDAVENRVQDGKGSWRRKGLSIFDRQLAAVHERICLKKPADYLRFLPFTGVEQCTSALLAERVGISVNLAQKTLYVLNRLGLVQKTGKEGRKLVYSLVNKEKKPKNSHCKKIK